MKKRLAEIARTRVFGRITSLPRDHAALRKLGLVVCAGSIAGAALVCFCSSRDNTWSIPGPGVGLMEHIGVWAIFISTPIVVMISIEILIKFSDTFGNLEEYAVEGHVPTAISKFTASHVRSLLFNGSARRVLLLFFVLGFYSWILNVKQTVYPFEFYENDVFDSPPYPLGFYSFKLYLLVLWGAIYPLAAFIGAHSAVSMLMILRSMCKSRLLKIDFFHEDNCGGVSIFGNINLLIMSLSGCILLVIFSIMGTHQGTYLTVSSAAYLFSALFIIQSIMGVYYIHALVSSKRLEALRKINSHLSKRLSEAESGLDFPGSLLAARNHIIGIKTFPYSKGAGRLVNFLRFAPSVIASINILTRL